MIERYIEIFGIHHREIIPLNSKKNSVFLIRGTRGSYILKIYKLFGKRGFSREVRILLQNHPPIVPSIIDIYKREAILLEFIDGRRLFDFGEEEFTEEVLASLSEWFYKFHKENPGYLRGDAIPQNFIFTPGGKIRGIDFEEAKRGDIIMDIAEFTAFILAWKRLSPHKRLEVAHIFLHSWQRVSHLLPSQTFQDYLQKFFRKFYFFRKDPDILTLISTDWRGILGF